MADCSGPFGIFTQRLELVSKTFSFRYTGPTTCRNILTRLRSKSSDSHPVSLPPLGKVTVTSWAEKPSLSEMAKKLLHISNEKIRRLVSRIVTTTLELGPVDDICMITLREATNGSEVASKQGNAGRCRCRCGCFVLRVEVLIILAS